MSSSRMISEQLLRSRTADAAALDSLVNSFTRIKTQLLHTHQQLSSKVKELRNEMESVLDAKSRSLKTNPISSVNVKPYLPSPISFSPTLTHSAGFPELVQTKPGFWQFTGSPAPKQTKPSGMQSSGSPVLKQTKPSGMQFTGSPVLKQTKSNFLQFTGSPAPKQTKPSGMQSTGSPVPTQTKPSGMQSAGSPVSAQTKPSVMQCTGSPVSAQTNPSVMQFTGSQVLKQTKSSGMQSTVSPVSAQIRPSGMKLTGPLHLPAAAAPVNPAKKLSPILSLTGTLASSIRCPVAPTERHSQEPDELLDADGLLATEFQREKHIGFLLDWHCNNQPTYGNVDQEEDFPLLEVVCC